LIVFSGRRRASLLCAFLFSLAYGAQVKFHLIEENRTFSLF